MSSVNFFTPIRYKNTNISSNKLLDKIDNFFFLGGKKAYVVNDKASGIEKVIFSDAKTSGSSKAARIFLYFTLIVPLIMLVIKAVLRAKHKFQVINVKTELGKGIHLKKETIEKIQQLMPIITRKGEHKDIKWLANGNNLIFQLEGMPNLVFKMEGNGTDTNFIKRFDNMIKAYKVNLFHHLNQLIVPHARFLEIKYNNHPYRLIVEESLDFNPNESMQEEYYHTCTSQLNETTRQLAVFIAKTGFNDVTWRNIPLLNEIEGYEGERRVGLIDLEEMTSVLKGFEGSDDASCGLIRCLSEEQIEVVKSEAEKLGVGISQEILNIRKNELEWDQNLREFYKKKDISIGNETIPVDLASLGLNFAEEGVYQEPELGENNKFKKWVDKKITLRQVVEEVVDHLNKALSSSSEKDSLKQRRKVKLGRTFRAYQDLGLPLDYLENNKNADKKRWLNLICQALLQKGYIFNYYKDGNGHYHIQA